MYNFDKHFFPVKKMRVNFRQYDLDWQDSRISRGNGKWICGKIPAGKEVREIAGKFGKIEPKIELKLTKNW